jgi:hypothetical protein
LFPLLSLHFTQDSIRLFIGFAEAPKEMLMARKPFFASFVIWQSYMSFERPGNKNNGPALSPSDPCRVTFMVSTFLIEISVL